MISLTELNFKAQGPVSELVDIIPSLLVIRKMVGFIITLARLYNQAWQTIFRPELPTLPWLLRAPLLLGGRIISYISPSINSAIDKLLFYNSKPLFIFSSVCYTLYLLNSLSSHVDTLIRTIMTHHNNAAILQSDYVTNNLLTINNAEQLKLSECVGFFSFLDPYNHNHRQLLYKHLTTNLYLNINILEPSTLCIGTVIFSLSTVTLHFVHRLSQNYDTSYYMFIGIALDQILEYILFDSNNILYTIQHM